MAFYASHGITVNAVMSDNGACYRSTIHAFACRALGIRHLRTRPYRPRTNGKAERFIRTLLAGALDSAIIQHPLGLRRDLQHQPRTHHSP